MQQMPHLYARTVLILLMRGFICVENVPSVPSDFAPVFLCLFVACVPSPSFTAYHVSESESRGEHHCRHLFDLLIICHRWAFYLAIRLYRVAQNPKRCREIVPIVGSRHKPLRTRIRLSKLKFNATVHLQDYVNRGLAGVATTIQPNGIGVANQMYSKAVTTSFENSAVSRRRLVLEDAWGGIRLWRVWFTLGWIDIVQRYRRSVLGPFWLTASMAVMVISLGFLYGQLFKMAISEFMPFICVGLIIWGFISSILNESGGVFCANELFIKQIRLPYTIYVWKFVWSKIIIFGHNFVIYIGVLIYFHIWPGAPLIFAIPGFVLIVVNSLLVSLYLGMISARFRDVPQIVAAMTQVVFFLTPVLWKPELLAGHRYVADWNPFYHLIEMVRSPLLGHWPSQSNVTVTLAITALNFAIAAAVFPRFRARIAYWV